MADWVVERKRRTLPESPASPTPYEVLGVAQGASQGELRRAYRGLLRQTHPDTGGDAARFHAVQLAWERIGDPADRAEYDRGASARFSPGDGESVFARPASAARGKKKRSSVRARSYGHPGGRARERFLGLIREFAGRGADVVDPYDAELVRSAPPEVRRALAKALAEEATARQVSTLGIGYTVWNGVAAGSGVIDHVILGPAGLFAIGSEDWGSEVRLVRGEVIGEALPQHLEPLRTLGRNAKALARSVGVHFTVLAVVVSDEALAEPMMVVGRRRRPDAVLLRRSLLPQLLRDGLTQERTSVAEIFEVRTRLTNGIRLV